MTEFETLQFTRTGSIVNIVLDRPDAANGMNAAMTRDLAAAATLCDTAETKVVTLTGAGPGARSAARRWAGEGEGGRRRPSEACREGSKARAQASQA